MFSQSFTCSDLLGIPLGFFRISHTGLSPSMIGLSRPFRYPFEYHIVVHTPSCKQDGLGSSAFARHYLRNHYCFLFLRLLRCFNSPGVASMRYFIHTPITGYDPCWVFPFGNLRIKGYLPLPEAYRSLSRPSSPTDVKAFTVRP